MKARLIGAALLSALALSSPGFATIDSLWISPATYGYKGALRDFSTGRATYFFVLDSAVQHCHIYDSDNFSQVYNFPLTCSVPYTYVYPYCLNDADGNGHPEVLVQDYSGSDARVRIIDMLAGTVVKAWAQTGYSYNVNCLVLTPGSNILKLALDKRNTSAPYPYTTELLVYSLGITLAVTGPPGASPGRSEIRLEQSYPNPAQSSAIIEFNLNQAGHAVLKIYNQLGQEVAKLVDQELKAGKHVVRWEGVEASSGVYYYQLQTPEGTETKKLVLMR
jgi:hypothetical protein